MHCLHYCLESTKTIVDVLIPHLGLFWRAAQDICFLKKYLFALKKTYIVYISLKWTFLKISFFEKGVLFHHPAKLFRTLSKEKKETPFPIIISAYYTQKINLCGNLTFRCNIDTIVHLNKVVFQALWTIVRSFIMRCFLIFSQPAV